MAEPRDKRRRGGHELPDSAQDRPEQNRGYDEAVRGGPAAEPPWPVKLLTRWPWLQRLPARFIGIGPRPEHIGTPDTLL